MFGRYSVCVWIIDIIYYFYLTTHTHMTHDITANICFHGNYQAAVELNIIEAVADLFKRKNFGSHV